jgi:hypothetical protein
MMIYDENKDMWLISHNGSVFFGPAWLVWVQMTVRRYAGNIWEVVKRLWPIVRHLPTINITINHHPHPMGEGWQYTMEDDEVDDNIQNIRP